MENKFHLEEFVKNNYNSFNNDEPEQGHFERFKAKLETHSGKKKHKILRLSVRLTSAAAIIIFGILLFNHSDYFLKTKNISKNVSAEPEEDFNEITGYYNTQIDKKLSEINKLECKEGVNQRTLLNNDLNELTNSFNELDKEYHNNPENSKIRDALINNYQMRVDMLDLIMNKLETYC